MRFTNPTLRKEQKQKQNAGHLQARFLCLIQESFCSECSLFSEFLPFLCSFNRIDIPPYESYEKFYDKLTCAVEETCGFAVE